LGDFTTVTHDWILPIKYHLALQAVSKRRVFYENKSFQT